MLVRISDLLSGAPKDVLHAIAHILLAKLYRRDVKSYALFVLNMARELSSGDPIRPATLTSPQAAVARAGA